MKKIILLTALTLAGLLQTGCIGLVVYHPRQKTMTHFYLAERGCLTNGVAAAEPLTEERLLAVWGQPDAQETNSEAMAVWHYRGEYQCSLIVPAYVIGLPIPIPAGHSDVQIYFKDGVAEKAAGPVMVLTGAMIGIYPPLLVAAWEREPDPVFDGAVLGGGFSKQPPDTRGQASQSPGAPEAD